MPDKPETEHKKISRNIFRIVLGILVTVLALWLSFRNVDWAELGRSLARVNLLWVTLAVFNNLLTVYALGIRWRILLKPEGDAPLGELFQINILSQCANIIMPARLGEVLRIYLASKKYRFTAAYVTGTVLIEKVLDFFVFVALWVLVPPLFAIQEKLKGYRPALLVSVLILGLIILFIWKKETILRGGKVFSRILPARLRMRFVDFFDRSLRAFALLKNPRKLSVLSLLTLAFIGGQILSNYFLFLAFGFHLSIWVALFLLLALQVGNIPPSSPGKVGIFEYAVILALSLFAVDKNQALSYGLVLHAVTYLPKILLGMLYFARLDITPRKVYNLGRNEN